MTSFSERYARAQARERRGALALHRPWGRSMRIAGATCYVSARSLTASRAPIFETTWSPAPPSRFTQQEIALVLAFRMRVIVDVRAELGFPLLP